jgi:uncharacterized cupredoxin-like copper-binding protein
MDRHRLALLAVGLVALAAVAGCIGADETDPAETAGDDAPGSEGTDDGGTGDAGNATDEAGTDDWQTVERTVVAKDVLPHDPPENYTYDVEGSEDKTITVPVNSTVELTLVSHEQNLWDHDVKVKDHVESDTIGPGGSLAVSFNVTEPGPSPFWCTIGDHRDRGMEGVLIVQPR